MNGVQAMRPIKSYYGNGIALDQDYCKRCKQYSFLDEFGDLVCCGVPPTIQAEREVVTKNTKTYNKNRSRKPIHLKVVRRVLERDNYKCYICGCDLNNDYYTSPKMDFMEKVQITIDHRIPYTFELGHNPDNLFASCNMCNVIKQDFIFDSDVQMREYILTKRKQKGIEIIKSKYEDVDEDVLGLVEENNPRRL